LRFLLLNQFYPPDPAPTGRYLHDVATELVGRGHDVRVVCSRKAYGSGEDLGPGQVLDGIDVRRVRGGLITGPSLGSRATEHLLYFAQAAAQAALRSPPADLVLAATSPPFLGLVGALARRWRGTAHAEWTMDVYPDVLQAHWAKGEHGWADRLLEALARFQLGRAELVLALGPSMAGCVARHLSGPTRLETVPLWSELDAGQGDRDWRARRGWTEEDLVLLYSGNMGRGHRFGEFLEAARRLGPLGPIWAFVGNGPRRMEVERFHHEHPAARIQLLPYVAVADVGPSLGSGDVHLVSLSKRWEGLIVPSKLQAAFSIGRPVIFVGPAENDAASWIRESGGGWIVEEGDVEAVLRAVQEARSPAERARRGQKARDYARDHFDVERNRARVADLLEECARARRAP
jgi:putative colanic acid biosynthesis glycosyltransferase WcaI